jgi:hypothetical protein
MTKQKDRQYNDQTKGQTIQWPNKRTDNTMTKQKDRQYNDQTKGQTIQWPNKRTDNTMTKQKDRQYNDQTKGQTIQWPNKRTDNTMTKQKDRQYKGQKVKQWSTNTENLRLSKMKPQKNLESNSRPSCDKSLSVTCSRSVPRYNWNIVESGVNHHNTHSTKKPEVLWRVSSSCSTNGTHHATVVTKTLKSHEWEKERIVITTNGTFVWSFVTQIFHNG